ncbi:hypothetical protein RvY_10333 [Ramazzottius varieornatus]|uniref:Uncharacterized protein n=1 Tax=Ramazzottius varieornatus TaxID=947166 RepID=A0A1D1VLF0_RAMVA|nr:hypothetical protein RvY_10333 [Ramazzottius varieornatus]
MQKHIVPRVHRSDFVSVLVDYGKESYRIRCFVCDNYAGHPADIDLWVYANRSQRNQPPCYKFKDTSELTPYIQNCSEDNGPPSCYAAVPALGHPDDTHSTRSCFVMTDSHKDGECYPHPNKDLSLYSCGCSTDLCNVYDKMVLDDKGLYFGVLTSNKTDSAKHFSGKQYVVLKASASEASGSSETSRKPFTGLIPIPEDLPQRADRPSADDSANPNSMSANAGNEQRIQLVTAMLSLVSVLAPVAKPPRAQI